MRKFILILCLVLSLACGAVPVSIKGKAEDVRVLLVCRHDELTAKLQKNDNMEFIK